MASNDNRIIFTSYLYDKGLKEIYSNASLYVSTSEVEGMPLTLLEAMSYAIPVLISPIPPHIEVVTNDEEYGYLFHSNEIDAIKDKLHYILTKPESEVIQKGLSGKQRILETFNWEKAANKLDKVYKEISNNG